MDSKISVPAPSTTGSEGASLAELLQRVERATGPDRELDTDVSVALGVLIEDPDHESSDRPGKPALYYIAEDDGAHVYGGLGDYVITRPITASIDAALALVERALGDGWEWCVASGAIRAWVQRSGGLGFQEAYAATAPLAILAAMLKVLRAQASESTRKDGSSPQNPGGAS